MMRAEEITSYKRQAAMLLDRVGIPAPYEHNCIVATSEMTAPYRYAAWLAESVHYACAELERDSIEGKRSDIRVVLRCYGQIREYYGRLENARELPFPLSTLCDAMRAIQNHLEDCLTKGV